MLAGSSVPALADNVNVVRELAARLGQVIGAAQTCQFAARPRVQTIIDKFQTVIKDSSTSEATRVDLLQLFDRSIGDGRGLVANGRLDCRTADRQFADLERSVAAPAPTSSFADVISPSSAAAAVAPTQTLPADNVRGVTSREIRFGIVVPFSGGAKETGQSYRQGIDLAFAQVNDAGGVNGRLLKLIPADDGFEPSRTIPAMKLLLEKEQVFGFFGNIGAQNAEIAVPFALEQKALLYAPFTGGTAPRHDPPDRYVFNYRASFVEEASAVVHYLMKVRRLKPNQIAAFGENDAIGEQGYAGMTKAYRALGHDDTNILRLSYNRNTVDVDAAVNVLKQHKVPIRAVVITATTRAAAKFIEKTRDHFPGLIYASMSVADGTALSQELLMLGPRFTENVIMTQAVPAVEGYSSEVLEYKNALAKYFPGSTPSYVSYEGYLATNILIDAIRRCGPQVDTERLVEALESTRNLDLGLGAPINFNRGEHQAMHKVWGTQLDHTGKYQPLELD
ncbi:ABC transporter substrate-binding protein [Bradyrhizobium sp. USDA 4353]